MNLQAMFPDGRRDGDKLLVRKGSYDWPAAIRNEEGDWVMTDFGRRFAQQEPKGEKPSTLHVPQGKRNKG